MSLGRPGPRGGRGRAGRGSPLPLSVTGGGAGCETRGLTGRRRRVYCWGITIELALVAPQPLVF